MNETVFKQALLDKLYAPYKQCMMCPLGGMGRSQVVFGYGNPNAKLVFVGEGPGRDEDLQGKPFVGRSGQLLNKVFELVGIKREDVFITNIVKCRPPNNRKPLPNEMSACKNILLDKQLQIIRPKIICTLGSAALEGLIKKTIKITSQRGLFIPYHNAIIVPTYHPAYILRNPKELEYLVQDIQTATDEAKKT